jgi:hypothetical protein
MSYIDEKCAYDSNPDDKYSQSYDDRFLLNNMEDDRCIPLNSDAKGSTVRSQSEFQSPKAMNGMSLNLSLAADAKPVSRKEEPGIQEEALTVVFELPDGSQGEESFKLGQTVEVLKSYVESEYGIPMAEQVLYLDDKVLQNPFSLLDYPEVKGNFSVYYPCGSFFLRSTFFLSSYFRL